jgi:hypothetical protein
MRRLKGRDGRTVTCAVIPAETGIQKVQQQSMRLLVSGARRNDSVISKVDYAISMRLFSQKYLKNRMKRACAC